MSGRVSFGNGRRKSLRFIRHTARHGRLKTDQEPQNNASKKDEINPKQFLIYQHFSKQKLP